MKTIDARGEICPKPLVMTKKGLKEAQENEVFVVLIDNQTSKENVERFLQENKVAYVVKESDGVYELKVTRGTGELLNDDAEAFCPISQPTGSKTSGDLIIINKQGIGHGPTELSAKLVEGFFTTIRAVDTPPFGIVFYNSGVYLALQDSPVLEDLKEISAKGCKILVCGTCVDHYGVKDQVGIGTISNMYDILGMMQKASKVFTP